MNRILMGLAGVCWLLLGGLSEGGLIFLLTDENGDPQSTFTITQIGQQIDVQLWLQEEDESWLTEQGLFSVGLKLGWSPGGIAVVGAETDVEVNSEFDVLTFDLQADSLTLVLAVPDIDYPVFPEVGADRIWLGTVTLTGLSGGTTWLTLGDNDPAMIDTLSGLGTEWDGDLTSAEARVDVVPEPGTLVMLLGLGLFGLRKRLWGKMRC